MKNCLLIFLTLISLSAYGQKYKLKKDILKKDKVAVAKVEGKVGLGKKDLSITTMENEQILIVNGGRYASRLPEMDPISWFTFSLPQLDKTIIMKENGTYFSTKQFLKHEFANKDIHFYADGLHEEELALLEDYTQQLHEDTIKLHNQRIFFKEKLPALHIERPASEPVIFGTFKNSTDVAIMQGKDENGKPIVIGKIHYVHNPGMSNSDPSRQRKIRIYKKLPHDITFNNEQTS